MTTELMKLPPYVTRTRSRHGKLCLYPQGQGIALDLRRDGHRGLLYPSVRHPGGRCFVAFDPGIIQNVRPGASWRFVWTDSPDYALRAV